MQLPLLRALRAADAGTRIEDLIAGTITAILLIPQGMAYAMLAGLPAQTGLYASILPPILYALFGSSRTLSVGPVAVAALMVANALAQYAAEDPGLWLSGALILSTQTGLILLLMYVLRLGTLVNFISHPVLSGFTSGAAILIIISQLKHLTGLALPLAEPWVSLELLWQGRMQMHGPTLWFGGASILLLILSRGPLIRALHGIGMRGGRAAMLSRTVPLLVVIGAIIIADRTDAAERLGVAVVGFIPAGLPQLNWQLLPTAQWLSLAPSALLIALVGFVESISVARVLAMRRRQKIDANQELLALGLSNLGAAVAGAMPVAGGFSRSVVNFEAGARTQGAAMVTALLVALVAVFFTTWFYHLPDAVLAAIIVVAVSQLIDWRGARHVFAYDRGDGATLVATLIGVVVFGIEIGLVFGIGLAAALYLRRTSEPHLAILGRIPGSEHFRNIERHAVDCSPRVMIIRVDENLYFANIAAVESFIETALAAKPDTRYLLLVMSAVSYIDSSAEDELERLNQILGERGIELHLSEVKGPVMDRLASTALGLALRERIHLSTHLALRVLERA